MKTIKYFGNEQKIYYEKLNNGLDVYIIPNHIEKIYHASIVAKYGSEVSDFVPVNEKEFVHLPDGIAHFLEHKVFDTDGVDAFSFFSKTGTYTNASTTFFSTRFFINGKRCFKKNFNYLLSMVFTPYFTNERVESERNIIAEEIKMYDDEPDWMIDYEASRAVYQNYLQKKIAGTVESISKIDANLLKKVYETFYQPSNMFVVVSGNVTPKEVIDILNNNEALKKIKITNQKIEIKKKEEVSEVKKEYVGLEGNIILPKLKYVYKFLLKDFKTCQGARLRFYFDAIFNHLFGDGSLFEEVVDKKKISTFYYLENQSIFDTYMLALYAESEYADLFKEEVDNTISNIHITKEDFARIKKVWESIVIRSLDNAEAIAN